MTLFVLVVSSVCVFPSRVVSTRVCSCHRPRRGSSPDHMVAERRVVAAQANACMVAERHLAAAKANVCMVAERHIAAVQANACMVAERHTAAVQANACVVAERHKCQPLGR